MPSESSQQQLQEAPAKPDDEQKPLKLANNVVLSPMQSRACTLFVTSKKNMGTIAKECGYASRAGVSRFLNSDLGKMGVEAALRERLLHGAVVGLKCMITLAESAKSETVRQAAAADLIDRYGLVAHDDASKRQSAGGGISIKIDLSGKAQDEPIDVTPDGEGAG